MPDSNPFWLPGHEVTAHADVAVTGCRLVTVVGTPVGGNPRVGIPAAGAKCSGVASRDAAVGEKFMIYKQGVHEIEAGAAIAAGNELQCDAAGRVIPLAGGKKVGDAWADAANGALAMVDLKLA